MEASETAPPETTEEPAEEPERKPEQSPAESRNPQELFRFSEWVHVGPGAEACDDAETGECTNTMHFHAWCRLPNQFQHQSIRDKALAAKARRIRQYRDADSDASAVIDGQFEEIEYSMDADAARNSYIEEIVFKDYMKDYFEVVQEMQSEEAEDDDPPKWASIEEDRERLRVLDDMDPEDRPDEEYSELKSHVAAFNEEVERRVKEDRQGAVRQSLQDRPLDELRQMVREQRIQKEAQAVYMQTYTVWEQYIGTMKTQVPKQVDAPQQRMFRSVDHLKSAAPEVIQVLDQVFTNLDGEFGKTMTVGALGKG